MKFNLYLKFNSFFFKKSKIGFFYKKTILCFFDFFFFFFYKFIKIIYQIKRLLFTTALSFFFILKILSMKFLTLTVNFFQISKINLVQSYFNSFNFFRKKVIYFVFNYMGQTGEKFFDIFKAKTKNYYYKVNLSKNICFRFNKNLSNNFNNNEIFLDTVNTSSENNYFYKISKKIKNVKSFSSGFIPNEVFSIRKFFVKNFCINNFYNKKNYLYCKKLFFNNFFFFKLLKIKQKKILKQIDLQKFVFFKFVFQEKIQKCLFLFFNYLFFGFFLFYKKKYIKINNFIYFLKVILFSSMSLFFKKSILKILLFFFSFILIIKNKVMSILIKSIFNLKLRLLNKQKQKQDVFRYLQKQKSELKRFRFFFFKFYNLKKNCLNHKKKPSFMIFSYDLKNLNFSISRSLEMTYNACQRNPGFGLIKRGFPKNLKKIGVNEFFNSFLRPKWYRLFKFNKLKSFFQKLHVKGLNIKEYQILNLFCFSLEKKKNFDFFFSFFLRKRWWLDNIFNVMFVGSSSF